MSDTKDIPPKPGGKSSRLNYEFLAVIGENRVWTTRKMAEALTRLKVPGFVKNPQFVKPEDLPTDEGAK